MITSSPSSRTSGRSVFYCMRSSHTDMCLTSVCHYSRSVKLELGRTQHFGFVFGAGSFMVRFGLRCEYFKNLGSCSVSVL